jgi:hypothetical protein
MPSPVVSFLQALNTKRLHKRRPSNSVKCGAPEFAQSVWHADHSRFRLAIENAMTGAQFVCSGFPRSRE